MKYIMKYILIAIVLSFTFFNINISNAAQEDNFGQIEIINEIEPIISSEDFIKINQKAIFDASKSITLNNVNSLALFKWNFGDGTEEEIGSEIIHEFSKSGKYKITLTIIQDNKKENIEKEIFIFDKHAILITDKASELDALEKQANLNGVWLTLIASSDQESNFLTEEQLLQKIATKADLLHSADIIMFYTESSIGIHAFTRYWSNLASEDKFSFSNKLLIKITDININLDAKLAQQSFEVLKPDFILLTRKEAINPIFEANDITPILNELTKRAIEFHVVDQNSGPSKLLLLSKLTTYFIFNGLPASTIYLILAFPFIAFIIAFARQVIGLSTFGVYAPALTSLAFLTLGLFFGLIVLFVVIAISYIIRRIFRGIDILYIPRVALILSIISLSFLGVIWTVLYFGSPVALSVAIFPMLVMSTISEKFTSAQAEFGFKAALLSTLETVAIAVFAYLIVAWQPFEDLLMGVPELVLLALVGDILVGRFSGLRLSEYFRFRSLLREGMEE